MERASASGQSGGAGHAARMTRRRHQLSLPIYPPTGSAPALAVKWLAGASQGQLQSNARVASPISLRKVSSVDTDQRHFGFGGGREISGTVGDPAGVSS